MGFVNSRGNYHIEHVADAQPGESRGIRTYTGSIPVSPRKVKDRGGPLRDLTRTSQGVSRFSRARIQFTIPGNF